MGSKADIICSYQDSYRGTSIHDSWRHRVLKGMKKRVRVKCPECGRRMIGWAAVCHDGCCVRYTVPRHKRKGWWKKRSTLRRGSAKVGRGEAASLRRGPTAEVR